MYLKFTYNQRISIMKFSFKQIILFITVAIVIFLMWYFISIIVYIIIAAVFSFLGRPLFNLLDKIQIKKIKIPKAISSFISLFVIWFAFFLFFRIITPLITSEIHELSNININSVLATLDEPIKTIEELVQKINNSQDFNLTQFLTTKLTTIAKEIQINNIFQTVAGTIGDIFIAIFAISFISFFFIKDSTLFQKMILFALPTKYEDVMKKTLESIQKLLVRYFFGILIEVLIIMILNTVGHSLLIGLDLSVAILIGLIAGLLNIIPYVGPIIGTVVGLLIGLLTNLDLKFYDELLPMLGYMSLIFISIQIIDNVILQPIIYGNSVHAHPLEIFLVIMIAGSIAGILGMVLAIPAYTVLRVVAKAFFNKYPLIEKITKGLDKEK